MLWTFLDASVMWLMWDRILRLASANNLFGGLTYPSLRCTLHYIIYHFVSG